MVRMKPTDRELGMGRRITRRDLLHGVGGLAAASMIPGQTFAEIAKSSVYYPPSLTVMRGNHEGSYEVAHDLARFGKTDWGTGQQAD